MTTQIYVPINEVDSHWYMAVIELEKQTTYIFDSLQDTTNRERRVKVIRIVRTVDLKIIYISTLYGTKLT